MDRLKAAIKSGKLSPIYMFYGAEDYLKFYYTDEIEKLLKSANGSAERITLEAAEFDIDEFYDSLRNVGFFGASKLFILRNLNIDGMTATDKEKFFEATEDMDGSQSVVLLYDDNYLETGDYNAKKRRKEKLLASCDKALKVEFRLQSDDELAKWLSRRVTAAGATLPRDVAMYILSVCDRRMSSLVGETEKLGTYAAGREVTKDDVDRLCIRSFDADIFNIVSLVQSKNLSEALRKIEICKGNDESPIGIVAALGASFYEACATKAAYDAGIRSADKIAADFGIKANKLWLVREWLGKAARLDGDFLSRALTEVHEVDLAQKTGDGDKWELLERLVMELCLI